MGKTARTYKGARTPQSLKEVRASARRGAVQQPKRTEAKSRVARAVAVIAGGAPGDAAASVSKAASALDRAAKSGAIHKNAAARRKSRLAKKAAAARSGAVGAAEPTTANKPAKKPAKKPAVARTPRAAKKPAAKKGNSAS